MHMYVFMYACMDGGCMYGCMHIYIWVQNPCLSLSVALLRGLWHFSIFCMVPHVGETWNVSNKTYVDARTILLSKGLDGPGCLQSTHRSAHSLWSGTWSESDLEPGDQLVTKCFKTLGQFILYSCYILWTTQHRRRKKTIQNCLYMYGTYTYIHIYIYFPFVRRVSPPKKKVQVFRN